MEGGKNYDSLPGDITRRIFSLLPLYLVLRLRLVCKAWCALITEFAVEYLKRSKETSLGIICCNSHRISSGMFSLDISSLQIRGGTKTLMTKTVSIFSRFAFTNSINGLICLNDAENNIHVFNPTTGEFVTLPPCHTSSYPFGFGYCRLTKQYKVVKIFRDFFKSATPVKAAVITVGAPSNSWRIIESIPPYNCLGGAIYLNGTLFWLSNTEHFKPHIITAFDVSDETFRIIRLPPKVLSCNLNCLAEQEGSLISIKTHLSAHSKENVISAIKYELDRRGQVFYVPPRIKGLEEVMEFLEQSFPTVEIAIAHGKQYSKQLEETMEKFALGEIKILICTNIVESGLDIQNANTIIVQEVQQFGLAQLYQLRGRVGRADKEAHAHLFYPDKSLLTDQALERLAALEECHELGQGFQLAERDMGIRGFGTIFGEQQTGDVGNVGIDLFFEMLFESLSKVEEHRVISVPYQSVRVDLNINPRLPSEYINYLENPMEIINEAEKAAEKEIWSSMQFTENLRRQYGKVPYSMELLLKKLYVRRMAADLGIKRIYASGKMVGMKTNMTKLVLGLITESMVSEVHRNSLVLEDDLIKSPSVLLCITTTNAKILHLKCSLHLTRLKSEYLRMGLYLICFKFLLQREQLHSEKNVDRLEV
uniref:F-box domain-containing protein n=1 Tax=Quercus lobata TaxID=97700 RepID=A0A7N2KZ43_QUELO